MKKIVLAVVAVLCAAQAQAQYVPGTLSVKPMVGAVNSTYIGMKESPKSIWGFVGGAEVDYQLSDMFGLSLGALYSQQGALAREIILCNCIPFSAPEGSGRTRTEYINVPLLLSFYPVKGLALKIGLQTGFLTKAEEKWVTYYEDHQEKHFDRSDYFRWYDFALPVGISYENHGIMVDLRYNYGLTRPINNNYVGALRESYWKTSGIRNSVLMMTLGYKIPIIKGKAKPKKEKTDGKQYIYEPRP